MNWQDMSLEDLLAWLAAEGCHPALYHGPRGWRAYVGLYEGTCGGDAPIPLEAMRAAVAEWESRGRPRD